MEVFLTIIFTFLALLALALVLFFLTIHPIWSIIDVAVAREKSTGEKVVFIILMFVLWSVGSVVYGLIFATRPLAITTRVLVASMLVLLLVLATLAIVAPLTIERLRDRIPIQRPEPTYSTR